MICCQCAPSKHRMIERLCPLAGLVHVDILKMPSHTTLPRAPPEALRTVIVIVLSITGLTGARIVKSALLVAVMSYCSLPVASMVIAAAKAATRRLTVIPPHDPCDVAIPPGLWIRLPRAPLLLAWAYATAAPYTPPT